MKPCPATETCRCGRPWPCFSHLPAFPGIVAAVVLALLAGCSASNRPYPIDDPQGPPACPDDAGTSATDAAPAADDAPGPRSIGAWFDPDAAACLHCEHTIYWESPDYMLHCACFPAGR